LHAFHGDSELILTLPTLKIIQDDAPAGVRAMVLQWARRHYRELLTDTQLLLRGQRPLAIAA
jgi:hypothetical protein